MNKFKNWLAQTGEEQQIVAAKLNKTPRYLSQLKRDERLYVNDKNELVRVTKVMDLWSVENESK